MMEPHYRQYRETYIIFYLKGGHDMCFNRKLVSKLLILVLQRANPVICDERTCIKGYTETDTNDSSGKTKKSDTYI